MTPFELRHDLAIELGNILSHMNFENQQNEECKINVFEQNLPIQKNDDDTEPYPYIIVKVMEGDIPDDESRYIIMVNLIIGIYYDNIDSQGTDIVLNVIQEVIERFRKKPVLNKKFIMQQKLKWAVQDDDTYPYYFGGIEMNWTVPLIQREGIYQ